MDPDASTALPSKPYLERLAARLREAAAAVVSAIEETRVCAAKSRVDVAIAAQGVIITNIDPHTIFRTTDSLLSAVSSLETAKVAALESDGVTIDEAMETVQRFIDMEVCSPQDIWRVCSLVDANLFGPSEQPTLLFVADEPPSATLGRVIHYPRPPSALLGEVASSLLGTSEVINTTIAEIRNNAISCREAVRDAAAAARAAATSCTKSESDSGGFIAQSSSDLLAKIDSIESRKVAALTGQAAVVCAATETLRRASTCWGSLTGEEAARVAS